MRYAKIENDIVVQIQPNKEKGFVQVDDSVICGMVVSGDTFVVPEKSEIDIQIEFRMLRDSLLAKADILINKAVDNSQDATKLRAYRQALRDATINWVMPSLEDYL